MSMIRYDNNVIIQAVSDTDKFCTTLENRLNELAGRLANIRDTWDSQQAREAFDARQQQWETAVERIKTACAALARALTESAENMTATDQRNAGYF